MNQKKNVLLILCTVGTMALVGCGGGGGSSVPTTTVTTDTTIDINTTIPPNVALLSCITKEASPTYTCAPTCANTEMDVLGKTYSTLVECETASAQWITAFNHTDTAGSEAQQEGLNYINGIRLGAGLTELKYSAILERATESHENYIGDVMEQYSVLSTHYENNESYPSEYYTGVYPWDRAVYAGYQGTASEVIAFQRSGNIIESFDVLLSAIYHRQGLLYNFIAEIGVGGNEQNFAQKAQPHLLGIKAESLEFIMAISSDIVTYPYAGETNIRRVFYEESPDPLPNTSMSGYPISVDFNPTYTDTVDVISFKLYEEDGTEVTNTLLMDEHNDPAGYFTSYQFALFPLDVLKSSHTYRVELEYIKDGVSGNRIWAFTTRSVLDK